MPGLIIYLEIGRVVSVSNRYEVVLYTSLCLSSSPARSSHLTHIHLLSLFPWTPSCSFLITGWLLSHPLCCNVCSSGTGSCAVGM